MYVGGSICLVLLLSSIFIYVVAFGRIRIARTLKHALVNIWIALAALVFLFCTGIHQVRKQRLPLRSTALKIDLQPNYL